MHTALPGIAQTSPSSESPKPASRSLLLYALILAASFLLLFLGQDRLVGVYDEGLVLTDAMRVMAGQVPHRDFYLIYGPLQSYLVAALFELFGPSVLVARLFDVAIKSCLVLSAYLITATYCRRSIAAAAALLFLLWFFAINAYGMIVTPIALLLLWATMLVLPVPLRPRPTPLQASLAGALAALTALFRYELGLALVAVHCCAVLLIASRRNPRLRSSLRSAASTLRPYLLGFLAVLLPSTLAYLSVAPFQPFLYDTVLFPGKYYWTTRNLPFPSVHLKTLENLAVYLPLLVVALCLVAILRFRRADPTDTGLSGNSAASADSEDPLSPEDSPARGDWVDFLIAFGLLATVMYLKGLVRISFLHISLALFPSILLVAVLFDRRSALRPLLRAPVLLAAGLAVLTPVWASLHELKTLHASRSSVLLRLLSPSSPNPPPPQTEWCALPNPLTVGLCFLPDPDHMRAIDFLRSHTTRADSLFVGVPHHDRIFISDSLTYFAAERLPATRWAHFDPGLQNRPDIQAEIIRELDARAPPYIALDAEFEAVHEPNDSSRSTGVHLLDLYLRRNYELTQTFGEMSIWRRIPAR